MLCQRDQLIDGVIRHVLRVESLEPRKENVDLNVFGRIVCQFANELFHFVLVTRAREAHRQLVLGFELTEAHRVVIVCFRAGDSVKFSEVVHEFLLVRSRKLSVQLAVKVKVEGGDRPDVVSLGHISLLIRLDRTEDKRRVFVVLSTALVSGFKLDAWPTIGAPKIHNDSLVPSDCLLKVCVVLNLQHFTELWLWK